MLVTFEKIKEREMSASEIKMLERLAEYKNTLTSVIMKMFRKKENREEFTSDLYMEAFGKAPDQEKDSKNTKEAFEKGRLLCVNLFKKTMEKKTISGQDLEEYSDCCSVIALQKLRDERNNQKFDWEDLYVEQVMEEQLQNAHISNNDLPEEWLEDAAHHADNW